MALERIPTEHLSHARRGSSLGDQSPPQERAYQPFGDVGLISGQTLAPFSRAGWTAADNLLAKAEHAPACGDLERAGQFVDRAVMLYYDRHEQTAPAALAASMMLFNAMTDALERSAEAYSRWLTAAVEAMSSASGWAESEMRMCCSSFVGTTSSAEGKPNHPGRQGQG